MKGGGLFQKALRFGVFLGLKGGNDGEYFNF